MKTIIYLLQVSACTGIFYSFYYLLLRRLTFFTLNRWYLLITLLLSIAIPALKIPLNTEAPSPILQPVMFVQQMQTIQQPDEISILKPTVIVNNTIDWLGWVKKIYIAIAAGSIIHLLITLGLFVRRMKNKKLMHIGNVKVLKSDTRLGNSSFMNVIFINDKELEPEEIKQVIAHEMLHVKLLHSADRLIARIIQIGLWFNPFAYFYIQSIEENHEFEVDRIAAGEDNKGMYAALLFKLAVSGQSYLFHGFSKVPLKTRITMLFNKPTSNMKKIIYVLTLPVLAISCLAFANLDNLPKKAASEKSALDKSGLHELSSVKSNKHKSYDDTIKYRQKRRGTPEELKTQEKGRQEQIEYRKTEDFKEKQASLNEVMSKVFTYKVMRFVQKDRSKLTKDGFIVSTGDKEFLLTSYYGQTKILNSLIKEGDEIQLKAYMGGFAKNGPISIEPAFIKKDGKEIYRAKEQSEIPKNAFLYEANRVRFTDGQVTNIQKYPNGKWKSAVVEVVNGFKIKFNIKSNAPEFKNIEWGDHVTFRFVHEVKTGAKEYTVNDWVSMTTDEKDYGIRNPDFFYKFYEKS